MLGFLILEKKEAERKSNCSPQLPKKQLRVKMKSDSSQNCSVK